MPGADDDDAVDLLSLPTAKTLKARAVFVEPQDGHLGLLAAVSLLSLIVRARCSNWVLQLLHEYS